jgi:hypothetical protein
VAKELRGAYPLSAFPYKFPTFVNASSSRPATPALLRGRPLYVTLAPEREMIRDHFSRIAFAGKIPRVRNGVAIDAYHLYTVSGFHGAVAGRVP